MKALIFNSGTGSRMGELTRKCPKCLVKLTGGESIFARQLRILAECGIGEAVVTTGGYEQELIRESRLYPDMQITFVNNPLYASTQYIYSMYLAGSHLDDDILMLHGDLVFDRPLVEKVLADHRSSLCLINREIDKPLKDFKGRIRNGCLREVGVELFDDDCYALQPMYKLSREHMRRWLDEVCVFVEKGMTNVYAENALNVIADGIQIYEMPYNGHYISEVDTAEDYERVNRALEDLI